MWVNFVKKCVWLLIKKNIYKNNLLKINCRQLIKNDSDLNSTLSLRYSFSQEKLLNLYFSNALGIKDIG